MTDITQADLDAAAALYELNAIQPWVEEMVARAFASHRLEERAKIVAWLRERLKDYLDECPDRWPIIDDIGDLLAAAEAGEHLK